MKSIIIIIALFLVTLTAKADWVKSGDLDSLYLGDAPITFSKYSPDYTKFVTYSAQDSTLRLWDLGTGKIIKERTFEWSYKFEMCEYEFESECFVFVNRNNIYNGTIENRETSDNYLYYINFIDKLRNLVTVSGNVIVIAPSAYGKKVFFQNLCIIGNSIQVVYKCEDFYSDLKGYRVTSAYSMSSKITYLNNQLIPNNSNYPYCVNWYNFHNGSVSKEINNSGVNIVYKDTTILYKFNGSIYFKNLPNIYTKLLPLDLNFDVFIYIDSNNSIQFFSKNEDQNINLSVPLESINMRNFKLISSPKYSIFFQDTNQLTLCDNQLKILIDTINLPEGNICYCDSTKYAYSYLSKTVYRNRFKQNIEEYDDIFTDKLFYKTNDSITLIKNINTKDSNLVWRVNGNLYYGNRPKFNIDKVGFYKVELSFVRNGKQYSIQKDSLIKVVDSLIYSDLILPSVIEVVKPKGWNYKYPFTIKSSWKNAKIDSYKWYINDSLISTNKELEYKFQFCNLYRVRLELSSIYFDRVFSEDVVALQDFQYSFSNTIGEKPFKLAIKYKHFATYDTLFNGYKAQYGSSILIFYQYINGKLERVADNYHSKNNEGSDTIVFNTIGTYLVRQENYLYFNDWITFKPEEMDTALTVLAPTDIQEFADRKYIFKQDADGIYCQLEGEGEVALYDNVGRLVRTYQIQNERYIRKEDLERGVYFLQINVNGEVYHEKVLVE